MRAGPHIERSAQPAVLAMFALFQAGRLPNAHAHKVRAIRVRIADALHDGQSAGVEQLGGWLQRRVQSDFAVDLDEPVGLDLQLGAQLGVVLVAIGHDGVQPVVAAIKLKDHEDATVLFIASGLRGARQKGRHQRRERQKRRLLQQLSATLTWCSPQLCLGPSQQEQERGFQRRQLRIRRPHRRLLDACDHLRR